jgi:hypothetical protein
MHANSNAVSSLHQAALRCLAQLHPVGAAASVGRPNRLCRRLCDTGRFTSQPIATLFKPSSSTSRSSGQALPACRRTAGCGCGCGDTPHAAQVLRNREADFGKQGADLDKARSQVGGPGDPCVPVHGCLCACARVCVFARVCACMCVRGCVSVWVRGGGGQERREPLQQPASACPPPAPALLSSSSPPWSSCPR